MSRSRAYWNTFWYFRKPAEIRVAMRSGTFTDIEVSRGINFVLLGRTKISAFPHTIRTLNQNPMSMTLAKNNVNC